MNTQFYVNLILKKNKSKIEKLFNNKKFTYMQDNDPKHPQINLFSGFNKIIINYFSGLIVRLI